MFYKTLKESVRQRAQRSYIQQRGHAATCRENGHLPPDAGVFFCCKIENSHCAEFVATRQKVRFSHLQEQSGLYLQMLTV